MNIENAIYPTSEQLGSFQESASGEGPIVMVNLLKFREKAAYPDGRDAHLSGREAYMRYAEVATVLIKSFGGRVLYAGTVNFLAIGAADSLWDEVALAEYPNRAAFLQMAFSPEMDAVAVHRSAGLEGQLNIATIPSVAVGHSV